MRLRFLPLLCVLLFAGCPKSPIVNPPGPAPVADHSIAFTWNQSFANNGACSTTVTTSCISGFNEGFITGTSTQNQLHTDTAAVCTGTTQPETCASTFNGVLPIGNDVFYVATTYVNSSGTAGVTSAALSPAVAVGADASTNVTVTVQ